jgi:hypothetical protein
MRSEQGRLMLIREVDKSVWIPLVGFQRGKNVIRGFDWFFQEFDGVAIWLGREQGGREVVPEVDYLLVECGRFRCDVLAMETRKLETRWYWGITRRKQEHGAGDEEGDESAYPHKGRQTVGRVDQHGGRKAVRLPLP